MRAPNGLVVTLASLVVVAPLAGCPTELAEGEGEGTGVEGEGDASEGEGDAGEGEGEGEEGEGEGDTGEGEGEGDGGEGEGEPFDGGNGFDLGSLLDGGVLECLPEELPELSIAGAFDALALGFYTGSPEDGVRCGLEPGRVTCDEGISCCNLCGYAACAAEDPLFAPDAGAVCPAFSNAYACDGEEDCSGNSVCCFTLGGTECRAEEDCDFDVGGALSDFLGDGGIQFPDAGSLDGGFVDGGFVDVGVDGGFTDLALDGGFQQEPLAEDAGFAPDDGGPVDAGFTELARDGGFTTIGVDGGFVTVGVDGGTGPVPDGGSLLDGLQTALDQGVPVCRSSLFDCDILSAEACCATDRLPALDLGFCLPALLCAGELLP